MKNDAQLKSDVEQELRWDPSVQAEQIGVSVKNGVVENREKILIPGPAAYRTNSDATSYRSRIVFTSSPCRLPTYPSRYRCSTLPTSDASG